MKRLLKSMLMPLLAVFLATAAHAFPVNQCAGDRYGADLGCTAQDVSLTGMTVVGDTTSCVGGTMVTLDLKATVNFAVPDRYDIGVFISNDGNDPQAMSSHGGARTCSVYVLPNSNPFLNLDGPTDTCGDGNGSIGGGTGGGILYMSNVTVPCQSMSGASGKLYIPFVVSWDNISTPPGAVCTSNADPVPNTKSKCNAPTIVQGSVAVVVLPSISKSDNISTIYSGRQTTYRVTITNTTGASLSGIVFQDPAVAGIAVSSLSCSSDEGATCPSGSSVAAMQGAGITLPAMPVGGKLTFSIVATLTGSPGDVRTNTASVTTGGQSNTASDSDTIVDTIAILPTAQAKSSDKGSTVNYTYTLYNFGVAADTITLSAASSRGWTVVPSPASVTVAAGGTATVNLAVSIPNNAAVGDVDVSTVSAKSGLDPAKVATATATTTVTTVLTLVPSNTGSGGPGSSVYYTHRVQNNASTSKSVSLTPSFTSGSCTGWKSALLMSNKTSELDGPVTLAANGGYQDFVLKVTVPVGAAVNSSCTATLTAQFTSGAANAVSVTDVTTVKNLILYEDPGYTTERYVYPTGESVYARGFALSAGTSYEYRWYDSNGQEVCTPRQQNTTGGIFPDTCQIPAAGPEGTWTVVIWNTTNNTQFATTNFYVGPDHLKAGYSGGDPSVNANAVVNLELHDKTHNIPTDASGKLVKGDAPTTENPLKVTVTVSGSAKIVSTNLTSYTISGQSVTGGLDATTGKATLTLSDAVMESVTITPVSYNKALYGSPLRDEPVTLTFVAGGPNHLEIQHGSGSGVTCTPSTLTVKACADALVPCTPYTGGVSGTLSAVGTPTVNWGGGSSAFSIPVGSSTVTKDIQVTTVGSTLLGAAATPAAATATTCNFGAPSCTFSVADAGFIVTVPDHVSDTVQALTIKAVKKADNSLSCVPGMTGVKTVNLKCSYLNPSSGTLPVRVGGTALNAAGSASSACDAGGRNVSLTFDASGVAVPTLQYADVGSMQVNANYIPGASDAGLSMTGGAKFIAAPASFAFSGVTAGLIKAGGPFGATVTAQNASGAATPNFGKESAAEGVTLTSNLVSPTGGNNPPLANNVIPGTAFASGSATLNNLSWGEVGIINLKADLTSASYLGSALTASGLSGNVGRFTPDHFNTAVMQVSGVPMACPSALTCPAAYNGFVYSAQPFTVQVTALNLAGATTLNYDSSRAYSKAVTLTAWDALGGSNANPGGGTLSSGSVPSSAFTLGVASVNAPTYSLPNPYPSASNPPSPTDVFLRAQDTDGVTSLRGASSVEGGVKVASGRIMVPNAYGSELLNLPVAVQAQYWNGARWVASTTDSASLFNSNKTTALPVPGNLAVTLAKGPLTVADVNAVSPGAAVFTSGGVTLTLAKPGPGKSGSADLKITAPGYLPSTTGRATFGIYKSRMIYLREMY